MSNFFPSGVNINIVEIKTKKEISVLTNERGVGITLACGTGACASVVAGHKLDLLEKKVVVKMPGGSIKVEIMTNNHILMTGNATKVFEGKIDMDELKMPNKIPPKVINLGCRLNFFESELIKAFYLKKSMMKKLLLTLALLQI